MIGLGIGVQKQAQLYADSIIEPPAIGTLLIWNQGGTGIIGSPVTEWTDQSGNGRDLLQATPGEEPAVSSGLLNGHDVVTFAGTPENLAGATLPAKSDHTFFFVFRAADVTNTEILIDVDDAARILIQSSNIIYQERIPALTTIFTYGISSATWYYMVGSVDVGGTSRYYLNGTERGTDTQSVSLGIESLYMGMRSFVSHWFNGDVAEFGIFDAALDATDVGTLNTYLSDRYSL